MITSKTKLYSLIGKPIKHSYSPIIHNKVFKEVNYDGVYVIMEISQERLYCLVEGLREIVNGFNVTIPYKGEIIKYLNELDETSKVTGAVNTVLNINGKLKGFNTDVYGIIKAIYKTCGENLIINKGLIIGAGGAARASIYALSKLGMKELTIVNRSRKRAEELVELSNNLGLKTNIIKFGETRVCEEANVSDIIVNATPVGFESEDVPLDAKCIRPRSIAVDLVYKPNPTNFLIQAKRKGAFIVDGISILIYQALKADEIWIGKEFDKEEQLFNSIREVLSNY